MTRLASDILRSDLPHEGAVYCLGTFDGVHRGHLHLVRLVREHCARLGLPGWALVLYRNPANPLFAGRTLITTPPERDLLFSETALDGAGVLDLVPSVTDTPHDVFVRDILLGHCRARHLVVGWDFHYGHARIGNVSLLRQQLAALPTGTCGLTMADPVMDQGEPIKSTTIRRWLTTGELARANAWLVRPFFVMGEVIEGRRAGRDLGFPTANLALPPEKLRPAFGVYVTVAVVDGVQHYAATNVGLRPTFGETHSPIIEAHLLDFAGDLYGKPVALHFLEYLRPERKFSGIETLQTQLHADVAAVRAYAEAHPLPRAVAGSGLPLPPLDGLSAPGVELV